MAKDEAPTPSPRPRPRRRLWPWIAAGAVVGVAVLWVVLVPASATEAPSPTWRVQRDTLRVSVTEGGSVQALKSTLVASQVEGETKILSIVPEGIWLTPADVESKRVLVELDSSQLRERREAQAITVSDAQSNVEQAQAALEIQKKQNESDVRRAEMDVQFARLDLDKFLGKDVAEKAATGRAAGATTEALKPLADDPALGGEALQALRSRQQDIDLAKEEVARAKDKLAWTEKLLAKGYVSQDEQVADRVALKRQEVALDQATTALALYRDYEFPKQMETFLSGLVEARDALTRVQARAASALANAESVKRGREEKARLEKDRLEKLEDQIASCVIRAQSPGLVVYASSEDRGNYMGDQNPIQEGTSIRQRQPIISLPDPKSMGVRINVHESAIDKVKRGQGARVVVDAWPDRPLSGRVARIASMPSSANRWSNPDLKVYSTDIAIDDPPVDLRPGLSAKVEVEVDEIEGALSVPLQAVAGPAGKPTVWVREAGGDKPRVVTLGASNDRFVEIKSGVSEGDVVLLAPPRERTDMAGESGTKREGAPGRPSNGRKRPDATMPEPSAAPAPGGGERPPRRDREKAPPMPSPPAEPSPSPSPPPSPAPPPPSDTTPPPGTPPTTPGPK